MGTHTDQAIVLRLSDYSETSQIATLFARCGGKLRLIAKGLRRGTRKRFAVGLDLLEYGQVRYVRPRGQAGLGTLAEWTQRDAFLGLRRALIRQYGAFYAVELTDRLTEEYDPHPELFAALLELLGDLAADETPTLADGRPGTPAALIVRFQAALLRAVGYAPVLRQCVDCGRPRVRGSAAYFSSAAGGLLCRACQQRHAEKRRLAPRLLDRPACEQAPEDWFPLLDYHLAHIAGGPARSSRRLGELITRAQPG